MEWSVATEAANSLSKRPSVGGLSGKLETVWDVIYDLTNIYFGATALQIINVHGN
jgi:hypothetical protein